MYKSYVFFSLYNIAFKMMHLENIFFVQMKPLFCSALPNINLYLDFEEIFCE